MIMKKVISIGINNAKGLTPLGAAVSGAKEFNDWASSQGYETILFTDEDGNAVTHNEIFTVIDNCIEAKKYEQIIIFFSGHGILKSPNQEVWLLSNAKSNPNESINLTLSIDYARTCGISYVVFISDACRVLPAELQLTGNGSVIFPIKDDTNQDCAIDIFYATRPGSPANEVNSSESSKRFGIFTQCLLEVLNGKYPNLISSILTPNEYLTQFYDIKQLKNNKSYKGLSTGSWEIYSTRLSNPLKSIVSKRANAVSLSLNQSPEIRIE